MESGFFHQQPWSFAVFPGHHLSTFAPGDLLALLVPKILQAESLDLRLETPRQVNTLCV